MHAVFLLYANFSSVNHYFIMFEYKIQAINTFFFIYRHLKIYAVTMSVYRYNCIIMYV